MPTKLPHISTQPAIVAQGHGPKSGSPRDETDMKKKSPGTLNHRFALDMIKRGHVKSFQEFFLLTHSEVAESQKSQKTGNFKAREDDVWLSADYKKIKQLLMEAEEAQLKGSMEDTFLAKEKLAAFYENRGDIAHATMHYTTAFTVASKIDPKHYTEGALRLGKTLERQNRFDDALRIYQQVFEFAKAKELSNDVSIIAGRIIECLLHHGQSLEETAVDKAIEQYNSAVVIAEQHCDGDRVVYSRIFHHLGLVHQKMGQKEEALKYLQAVLDNASSIKDVQQEWLARSALANCLKSFGNLDAAIDCVTEFVKQDDETKKVSEAWRQLGLLYLQKQDYAAAVGAFQQAYDIVLPSQNLHETLKTALQLGVAIGQSKMADYVDGLVNY